MVETVAVKASETEAVVGQRKKQRESLHGGYVGGRDPFFWFWMLLGSSFPKPKSARKDVSANQNGEIGGK
jgi:hypothetical protein